MKIAVTGANGFIGSHLINKLLKIKKVRVYPFERNKHSLFNLNSLKEFVKDKDVIIHLAGKRLSKKQSDLYKTNVLGTANLLEAASSYGKRKVQFIFASSFAVYEPISTKKLLDERKARTRPRNHYGMSKLLAEKLVSFYHRNKKLKTGILRLANVYGPDAKPSHSVVANFIDHLIKKKPITVNGTGQQGRDFIYIDDVVDALIQTIKYQKEDFLLVNICSGKETKIRDLIKKIEKILGKRAVVKYNKRHQEKGYWIGNLCRAFNKIKFKAKTDLETGLMKTINWYPKN